MIGMNVTMTDMTVTTNGVTATMIAGTATTTAETETALVIVPAVPMSETATSRMIGRGVTTTASDAMKSVRTVQMVKIGKVSFRPSVGIDTFAEAT
jgi:TolB-like protein